MKVRQGFVSNSSTTSFLIFGLNIDLPDIDDLEAERKAGFWTDEFIDYLEAHSDEYISDILYDLGVDYEENEDDESFIGISDPDDSDDSKTIGQMKDDVITSLKKVIKNPDRSKIHFFAGGGYNG
jgi:hypothetical protein